MFKLKEIIKNIRKIPETPGVYIFRDREKSPVYVGKAVNLRNRLVSHFKQGGKSGNIFRDSIYLDIKATESEIEALLLEADLIKHFKPKYNVVKKDDKSFLYLVVRDDKFPYLEFVREKNLNLHSRDLSFGPFVEGRSLRETVKTLRQIFRYRDCCPLIFEKAAKNKRPCLYYSLGRCSAPCIQGLISQKDYKKLIRDLILFLKNKKSRLIKKWQQEMFILSEAKKYEQALIIRDRLKSIERLKKLHFIEDSVPKAKRIIRIEIYDVAQIFGEARSGAMIVYGGILSTDNVISGTFNKNEWRKFKLSKGKDDLSLLAEMVERRFKHAEWQTPDLILVDGGANQVRSIQKVLEEFNLVLPVVGITKNKKHKAIKPTMPADRFKWPYLFDLVQKNWLLFVKLDDRVHQFSQSYFKEQRKRKLFK
ncbi:MAG: GIY-YIG nuclease family protein [Patescibacteria group bacterium]|nr:GIY-YIG nuclease family protein [Patescibacteria group bacterium]